MIDRRRNTLLRTDNLNFRETQKVWGKNSDIFTLQDFPLQALLNSLCYSPSVSDLAPDFSQLKNVVN